MPKLEFPDFLERFQLQLLGVSTTDVVPGVVVDKARRGFQPQGHLSELLPDQPNTFWETEINEANIVYGGVERRINLGGKASLNEMGVSVEGGLRNARTAVFTITGISARTFVNGIGHATKFSIMPLVHELRQKNRTRWRLVNGKWIVFETYYATQASVVFDTEGGANIKADVEEAGGVSVHGGGEITWKGNRGFIIANNNKVPFAFRGWQV